MNKARRKRLQEAYEKISEVHIEMLDEAYGYLDDAQSVIDQI